MKAHTGLTPYEFKLWEKRAKEADIESLYWSLKDCRETIAVQPHNYGKYADQASIFLQELKRRGL